MACCCCFTTTESTVKIIESFGKFKKVAKPGFSFLTPCMETIAGTVSLRLRLNEMRVTCKTLDNVFVEVEISVHYVVIPEQVENAFYKLQNAEAQIESYVTDVIRAEVPKFKLDDVFTAKEQLADKVKEEVSSSMEEYGYIIIATPVTDLRPDANVRSAMNEINRQLRLKKAASEQGDARKIIEVKAAEAEAERIRIEAAADADAKFLAGQGISRQRQALVDGLSSSVRNFSNEVKEIDPKEVMEMIIVTQYFDTMKELTQNGKTTTIFTNSGGSEMRNSMLESTAAPAKVTMT